MNTYDVIVVGAGPAGIFSALELLSQKKDMRILIVEKGKGYRQKGLSDETARNFMRGMP